MGFVVGHIPTYKEFTANLEEKMRDGEFLGDTSQLLRSGADFRPEEAFLLVKERLIDRLRQ